MRVLVLIIVLILTGCTTDKTKNWNGAIGWSGLVDQKKLNASNQWAIDKNVAFYVVIPPQEILDEAFHRSITALFKRYYPKTRASTHRETLQQSFASAQYAGMDYIVYPQIRNRVQRQGFDQVSRKEIKLGELRRAVLEMDILIYTANSEKIVDQLEIVAKTSIFNAGSDDAEMIFSPLDAYLRKISQSY